MVCFLCIKEKNLAFMNFDKYTIKSQEAIQKSAEIAITNQHQAIEPGHLLKAVLETVR